MCYPVKVGSDLVYRLTLRCHRTGILLTCSDAKSDNKALRYHPSSDLNNLLEQASIPLQYLHMSRPYYSQQDSYAPGPARDAGAYAPPAVHHQTSAYGYETKPSYQEEDYAHDYGQPYYEHSTHIQTYSPKPEVHHSHLHLQPTATQNNYLDPATATAAGARGSDSYQYDNSRLSPHYEPRGYQGSNAEYYDGSYSSHGRARPSSPKSYLSEESRERGEMDNNGGGGERGLAGALVGGATGYYLDRKKSHGLLGAVGGALLGSFLQDKMEERKDDPGSGSHSHHGRRRRHHHHHHGHGHGHRHHRSGSRHSHRSRSQDG
ncbi:hypothetical protein BJX61DRAFT_348184 [Aspergillus egyptiacus]|nr:hypothetical protein BJX61DRAFT_348184 [Aspergillus egyptiacus]